MGDIGGVMTTIVLKGWQDLTESRPISLVDAIRRHIGLSLPEAKQLIDQFAEQGWVVIVAATAQEAELFAKEARSLGVVLDFE